MSPDSKAARARLTSVQAMKLWAPKTDSRLFELADVAVLEQSYRMEGRTMHIVLAPKSQAAKPPGPKPPPRRPTPAGPEPPASSEPQPVSEEE